jgi:hypothetical protein
MPANDYSEGIDGAGSAWEDGVDTDEAKNSYQSGATSDTAEDYEDAAGDAGDAYAEGVAEYAGIDEGDVTVDSDYEDGASEAGSNWQQGVSGAGEDWADGVQGKGDKYEENAADSAQEWFSGYVEGVQD